MVYGSIVYVFYYAITSLRYFCLLFVCNGENWEDWRLFLGVPKENAYNTP